MYCSHTKWCPLQYCHGDVGQQSNAANDCQGQWQAGAMMGGLHVTRLSHTRTVLEGLFARTCNVIVFSLWCISCLSACVVHYLLLVLCTAYYLCCALLSTCVVHYIVLVLCNACSCLLHTIALLFGALLASRWC